MGLEQVHNRRSSASLEENTTADPSSAFKQRANNLESISSSVEETKGNVFSNSTKLDDGTYDKSLSSVSSVSSLKSTSLTKSIGVIPYDPDPNSTVSDRRHRRGSQASPQGNSRSPSRTSSRAPYNPETDAISSLKRQGLEDGAQLLSQLTGVIIDLADSPHGLERLRNTMSMLVAAIQGLSTGGIEAASPSPPPNRDMESIKPSQQQSLEAGVQLLSQLSGVVCDLGDSPHDLKRISTILNQLISVIDKSEPSIQQEAGGTQFGRLANLVAKTVSPYLSFQPVWNAADAVSSIFGHQTNRHPDAAETRLSDAHEPSLKDRTVNSSGRASMESNASLLNVLTGVEIEVPESRHDLEQMRNTMRFLISEADEKLSMHELKEAVVSDQSSQHTEVIAPPGEHLGETGSQLLSELTEVINELAESPNELDRIRETMSDVVAAINEHLGTSGTID